MNNYISSSTQDRWNRELKEMRRAEDERLSRYASERSEREHYDRSMVGRYHEHDYDTRDW